MSKFTAYFIRDGLVAESHHTYLVSVQYYLCEPDESFYNWDICEVLFHLVDFEEYDASVLAQELSKLDRELCKLVKKGGR